MRKTTAVIVSGGCPGVGHRGVAPVTSRGQRRRRAGGRLRGRRPRSTNSTTRFLQWPLPAGGQAYADIDGRRLHTYVVDQAAISRRYRDQGHPQFWGRVIGSSADTGTADWLAGHFTRIGLSDVRIQPIDLAPQWMPQSWEITRRPAADDAAARSIRGTGVWHARHGAGRPRRGRRLGRHRQRCGLRRPRRPRQSGLHVQHGAAGIDEQHVDAEGGPSARKHEARRRCSRSSRCRATVATSCIRCASTFRSSRSGWRTATRCAT